MSKPGVGFLWLLLFVWDFFSSEDALFMVLAADGFGRKASPKSAYAKH